MREDLGEGGSSIKQEATTSNGQGNLDAMPILQTRRMSRFRKFMTFVKRQSMFLGGSMVAAVSYLDPGNWSTDLSAGTSYGYTHLFIILISSCFAIYLQVLACRLGVVSNVDLAQHLRRSLHSRPKHRLVYRWLVLYPLYAIYEAAIVFTDLAELLGSAIAINLLIPKVPLWAGVLLTSADVFIILLCFPNYDGKTASTNVRVFEFAMGILIMVILACFCVLLDRTNPDWPQAFRSYLPTSGFALPGAIYAATGILGATVMPHSIVLGSRIACVGRYARTETTSSKSELVKGDLTPSNEEPEAQLSLPMESRLQYIKAHIKHASIDMALSLTSFALVINSAILIVAASAFNRTPDPSLESGDLFAAHALIKSQVGAAPAFLFALGLLLSGQLASVTVTLSGQVISEGFLRWTISPWIRRLMTRCIGMVPSLVVAAAFGRSGLDTLLVASQVALSIILPFIIVPLLIFTSQASIMTVDVPVDNDHPMPSRTSSNLLSIAWHKIWDNRPNKIGSFANSWLSISIGLLILTIVLLCNVYSLVELGSGQG